MKIKGDRSMSSLIRQLQFNFKVRNDDIETITNTIKKLKQRNEKNRNILNKLCNLDFS